MFLICAVNVHFKQVGENDVAVLSSLAEKIWRAHYPSIIPHAQIDYMLALMYSESSLNRQLSEGHRFLLLNIQERPAGYFSISNNDGRHFFLHKFYLDTSLHFQGFGTLMMDELLRQLPATAEQLELFVNRQNIKAINFYFRHGFSILRVVDNHIGGDFWMNDFVMRRLLK